MNDKKISYHKIFCARGIKYDCRLKNANRVGMINISRQSDKYYLKEYSWEGKPAFYIINTRTETDIGVVPKEFVERFKKYIDDPRYETEIQFIEKLTFEDGGQTIKFQFIAYNISNVSTSATVPIATSNVEDKREKDSKAIMWCLLVLIPPAGLIYLWTARRDKESDKTKKILSVIFGIYVIIWILFGAINNKRGNESETVNDTSTIEVDAMFMPELDTKIHHTSFPM